MSTRDHSGKYTHAKIYRLCSDIDDEIYIGSTCNKLSSRLVQHKRQATLTPNRTVYDHINRIGWETVKCILIEEVDCNNREQLLQRERYYIEMMKPGLNRRIPIRIDDERKELKKQSDKDYREANREKISECQKQYREANRETKAEYNKLYREDNRESIQEFQNTKNICPCGGRFTTANKTKHFNSKLHKSWASNNQAPVETSP